MINFNDPKWIMQLDKIVDDDDTVMSMLIHLPASILFIEDPKPEWLSYALSQNSSLAHQYDNLSIADQTMLLEKSLYNIQYIKNIDEALAIKYLSKEPSLINYVNNPTLSMKNCAVLLQ